MYFIQLRQKQYFRNSQLSQAYCILQNVLD